VVPQVIPVTLKVVTAPTFKLLKPGTKVAKVALVETSRK